MSDAGSSADRDPAPDPRAAATDRALVEGEDYYVEAGRWVFTAAHHLRRGTCCDSGCRHCPYCVDDIDRWEPIHFDSPK